MEDVVMGDLVAMSEALRLQRVEAGLEQAAGLLAKVSESVSGVVATLQTVVETTLATTDGLMRQVVTLSTELVEMRQRVARLEEGQ